MKLPGLLQLIYGFLPYHLHSNLPLLSFGFHEAIDSLLPYHNNFDSLQGTKYLSFLNFIKQSFSSVGILCFFPNIIMQLQYIKFSSDIVK
jgi:hypothetical protein